MADTAHKSGGSLSGAENPTAAQKLLDASVSASGITELTPAPSSDPGWEGNQVLAARVATFKALPNNIDYTQNPFHSTNANSTSSDNPSVSSNSGCSQASYKSYRSPVISLADAFEDDERLTDEDQGEVSRRKNKSKKNGRVGRNAPRERKSGGSMTRLNMVRLSAEHAYHERVAARYFTHDPGSNTYCVRKRDGLIFDNGTRYKKGAYVSEDSVMTFTAAVIERQPTAERDAATAKLKPRDAKTSSPSQPRSDQMINSSKDARMPGAPGDPGDESDGSTSNSSHNQTSQESASTRSSGCSVRSHTSVGPAQPKPTTLNPKTRRGPMPSPIAIHGPAWNLRDEQRSNHSHLPDEAKPLTIPLSFFDARVNKTGVN